MNNPYPVEVHFTDEVESVSFWFIPRIGEKISIYNEDFLVVDVKHIPAKWNEFNKPNVHMYVEKVQ